MLTKISSKMQNGSARSIELFFLLVFCLFCFVFYSLPALNLHLKVFIKLHDSNFKNKNFFSFWGGTFPSHTSPCASKWAFGNVTPHQIIKKMEKKKSKTHLCPWLGGNCNFEVGERFGRWCLVQGNNSDFLSGRIDTPGTIIWYKSGSFCSEPMK